MYRGIKSLHKIVRKPNFRQILGCFLLRIIVPLKRHQISLTHPIPSVKACIESRLEGLNLAGREFGWFTRTWVYENSKDTLSTNFGRNQPSVRRFFCKKLIPLLPPNLETSCGANLPFFSGKLHNSQPLQTHHSAHSEVPLLPSRLLLRWNMQSTSPPVVCSVQQIFPSLNI